MEDNNDLTVAYDSYLALTASLVQTGYSHLQIAGVMMAQAMTIYKNSFSEDEFQQLLESIIEMSDKVPLLSNTNTTLQ